MVIPEALSYGLPVVCLHNSGPGQLVDNHCAIRVPHGSYEETVTKLANALEFVYGDGHNRRKMSQAAFRRVTEYLSWTQKGEQIQSLYEKILES